MCFEFEVEGQMVKERLKMTWNKQVEEDTTTVGLSREDVPCQSIGIAGVDQIVTRLGESGHPLMLEKLTDLEHWFLFVLLINFLECIC